MINNSYICECSFHFDLPPKLRLKSLFDSNYEIIEPPENVDPDPLNFEVKERYKYIDKIKRYREKTGQKTNENIRIYSYKSGPKEIKNKNFLP